jgi:hypothetical protein
MAREQYPCNALGPAVLAGDAEFCHFDNGQEWRGCRPKDVLTTKY